MARHNSHWLGAALVLAVSVGCVHRTEESQPVATPPVVRSPDASQAGSMVVGQPAPSFDYERLGGGRISLAELRGKTVAVLVTSYT